MTFQFSGSLFSCRKSQKKYETWILLYLMTMSRRVQQNHYQIKINASLQEKLCLNKSAILCLVRKFCSFLRCCFLKFFHLKGTDSYYTGLNTTVAYRIIKSTSNSTWSFPSSISKVQTPYILITTCSSGQNSWMPDGQGANWSAYVRIWLK